MSNITNELSSLFWIFLVIGVLALATLFAMFLCSIFTISSRESRAEEKRNGIEPQVIEGNIMKSIQELTLPDGTVFTVKKGRFFYYLFVDGEKFAGPFLTVKAVKRYAIIKFNLYWSL